MKYIPYLIPKKSKVLPEYFKESNYSDSSINSLTKTLLYIGSMVFFILTLVTLAHPLLSLFFLIPGLCLLPPIHNWIEKKMRFEFTPRIKAGFICILLLSSFPLIGRYSKIDKEKEIIILAQKEKNRKIELVNKAKDKQRQDSLEFYIQQSVDLQTTKHDVKALEKLKIAETFVVKANDKKAIDSLRAEIFLTRTMSLVKKGKYKDALPELDNLLAQNPSNSYLLYQKAFCLNKTGKVQDAVDNLGKAIELGNNDAKVLYEKINPIKRRVSYYVTRCCDGSTSSATGRGACSHHGGVCDWNDPVYEEYRKY